MNVCIHNVVKGRDCLCCENDRLRVERDSLAGENATLRERARMKTHAPERDFCPGACEYRELTAALTRLAAQLAACVTALEEIRGWTFDMDAPYRNIPDASYLAARILAELGNGSYGG